jgi:hypothetical protein
LGTSSVVMDSGGFVLAAQDITTWRVRVAGVPLRCACCK